MLTLSECIQLLFFTFCSKKKRIKHFRWCVALWATTHCFYRLTEHKQLSSAWLCVCAQWFIQVCSNYLCAERQTGFKYFTFTRQEEKICISLKAMKTNYLRWSPTWAGFFPVRCFYICVSLCTFLTGLGWMSTLFHTFFYKTLTLIVAHLVINVQMLWGMKK